MKTKNGIKRVFASLLVVVMLLTSVPLAGVADLDFSGVADWFATTAKAAEMKDVISAMSVGDTITYGNYPQTDVTFSMGGTLTAAAPSTKNWKSYNYYYKGTQLDYMKYYDLSYDGNCYRGVYFTKYRPIYSNKASSSSSNSNQNSNGYSINKIYWFKYEPLTWRILDPSTGYVLCENIIDSQAFNDEYYSNGYDAYGKTAYYNNKTYKHLANDWKHSSIRRWLNEIFFTTAFTSNERAQIPYTRFVTPAYSTLYSAYDVGETNDYVFLPSYQDMLNTSYGFSSDYSNCDINRIAHSSDYAKSQGVWFNSSYTDKYGKSASNYRLRSPARNSYSANEVFCDGSVNYYWPTYSASVGIRPVLCFNPSSTATGGKNEGKATLTVSSNDSYDRLNKLPLANIGTKLKNFTVTTVIGSKHITDSSSVKVDIVEAEHGGVKISKDYYQDYIIPADVFENIFNEGFSANLSVKMSALPNRNTGYISTAFVKESAEDSSYADAVVESMNLTKGNDYKIILSAAGVGSNVKYYLSQNEGHKIESTTGIFEGDLFSQFVPYRSVYAYATSSKGTTDIIELKLKVVPSGKNQKIDEFFKTKSTNLLGDAPTSFWAKTENFLFEGAKFDLSEFKVPLSVAVEGNTVKVAIGIEGLLSYEHETKGSSTTGTKWKKNGEWSNFIKDYKEYFEKDHSWAKKKEKAKEANNKARELTEKYGKKKSVKAKKHEFSLDVVGYGIWEIVWNGDSMKLVFKEGSAAVTGSLSYEYCQNGFAGPCPGYMYFGFGASLTVSAKNSRNVADSSAPMQWEFSVTLEPEITAGAGVGWKNWASLGLYGKASAPIYLRPELKNKSGKFQVDIKGEIGIEATALFVFKTKKKILNGTMNVIDKTWSKKKSLKTPAMLTPDNVSEETPKMAKEVESADRSYASGTSQWLGQKSALSRKSPLKANMLAASGLKFTTLQESVFYAPQTQLALVGDRVLMAYIEDDTTRTANNRMRLMYTLFDPSTESWSQPKPVSDNGRNDSYPYLVSNGDNIYITWIKSNTLYPDDLSNTVDVYRACEVYLAKFDAKNEIFTNVTRVTDDDIYDYNPSVAIDANGNPVVYYASCTDNDTFGKNNTITKYTGTKTVLEREKYYILSMTANSDATELTYIMDKNGDTGNSTDVNAYTIKDGATTEINHEIAISDAFYANLNGEEKLFFSDRTNVYYIDENGEATAVLNSNTGISSSVYPVETDNGLAFIFTKKNGETAELFSVSQTDDGWTEPVQISTEEKLIENVAVVSKSNRLYGCITTKENNITDLVGFSFDDFTDVSLGDISVSELEIRAGEDNKFTVSVFNNGTNKIDSIDFKVGDTLGTNSEQTVEVNLDPGEMKLVKLVYHTPENYSKTTLSVSADVVLDKNKDDNTVTKTIGLPDISLKEPIVKENADHYVITTYAENVSDIPAKNVFVSVKDGDNNLIEPIQYDELVLLQREEISVIVPKSSVAYDDGVARVIFSALCDENSNEVIAVLTDNSKNEKGECNHIETKLKETSPTCEDDGKAEAICVSCGEVLGTVAVLEKLEHALVIDTEAKEPTCTEPGTTEGSHCTRCDYKVEAEVFPALGHTDQDGDGKCDRCGYFEYLVGECGDNAHYKFYPTGELVISGTGSTYGIDDLSFADDISKVTIEDGITEIGNYAFIGCTGLTNVSIPNSVTSIGSYAFFGCTGLTDVTIPDSVTDIGFLAFDGTPWYNAQPDGELYLGKVYYAYRGEMPENTSVTIKDGTKAVAPMVFRDCSNLIEVTIPESVENVGDAAFYNCTNLKKVNWNAESVNDFETGYRVFYNAGTAGSGIDVVFGDNVKHVPSHMFFCDWGRVEDEKNQPKVKSVKFGNSVESVGEYAFALCKDLESITFNSSISFDETSFIGCTGFKNVMFGSNVTNIGFEFLMSCTSAERLEVAEDNKVYHSINNCVIETQSKKLVIGCKNSVIPTDGSVTSIGEGAFVICSGLTSLEIPKSVTSIGEAAFAHCTELTSVTIPNGVTGIGEGAFYDCTGLTSVTIPKSVTDIGDMAFGYYFDEETQEDAKIPDFIIYGCAGTAAETYANENGFTFAEHTHSFSDWAATTMATCTEAHEETRTCSVCDVIETRTVAATGHAYVDTVTAATCTTDGYTTHTCSVCGESYTDSVVKALGHTDTDNDGKCDRCGEKTGEPVNPPQPDPSANCTHICHKSGISAFFYRIARFFWKLFKTHKYCSCGAAHY